MVRFLTGKLRGFRYASWRRLVVGKDTEQVCSRRDAPVPTFRHVAGVARRRGSRKSGKYSPLRGSGMRSSTLPGPDFGRRAIALNRAILALLSVRRPVSPSTSSSVSQRAGNPITWRDNPTQGSGRPAGSSRRGFSNQAGVPPTLPGEPSMTDRKTACSAKKRGRLDVATLYTNFGGRNMGHYPRASLRRLSHVVPAAACGACCHNGYDVWNGSEARGPALRTHEVRAAPTLPAKVASPAEKGRTRTQTPRFLDGERFKAADEWVAQHTRGGAAKGGVTSEVFKRQKCSNLASAKIMSATYRRGQSRVLPARA
jgi:hypothetical protein